VQLCPLWLWAHYGASTLVACSTDQMMWYREEQRRKEENIRRVLPEVAVCYCMALVEIPGLTFLPPG